MHKQDETGSVAAIFIVIAGIVVAITCTGCGFSGSTHGHTYGSQEFVYGGTAEGIRAFNDGLIGMAKTAKESDDVDNQYIGYRAMQEKEVTQRELRRPGFWQKLTGQTGIEK
jgi:hypothetical protein